MEAEFAEKHFENLANQELGFSFSSDQVSEYQLGYDAIAHPVAWNPIWAILGYPRPRGHLLSPGDWFGSPNGLPPATTFPPFAYSLVLQYKRPEYIRSHAGLQWQDWHAPYYRFGITDHQQAVLAALEANLANAALVRYASPAFHTNAVLYGYMLTRTVISHSGFVAPSRLVGHRFWTYQNPGVDGIANPHEPSRFEAFDDIRDYVAAGLSRNQPVREHLAAAAASIRESVVGTPIEEFVVAPRSVRLQEFDVPRPLRALVASVELVQRFTLATEVRWTLLLTNSRQEIPDID